MTPYELLDLALSLSNRIDTHWTLFISIHLALIGGIIYVDRPLLRNEKIAGVVMYTAFAVLNYIMMKSQAQFLGSVYHQIFEIKDQYCCTNNRVIDHVVYMYELGSTSKAIISITIAHIAMYVLLTISIVYDRTLSKKLVADTTDKPESE